jgi:hypothetical protein
MTWTKLSDDFGEDCWTLSDAAFRLHVEALVWSNFKLLDGRITKDDLRRFAKNPDAADTVTELLDCGFWIDDGDAFVIVHHLPHQPTREQVIAFRQSRQQNGRKGGRPRKTKQPENLGAYQGANQGADLGANLRGRDGTGRVKDGPATTTTTDVARDRAWLNGGPTTAHDHTEPDNPLPDPRTTDDAGWRPPY